jgi:DNA polymerase III alpha subunit
LLLRAVPTAQDLAKSMKPPSGEQPLRLVMEEPPLDLRVDDFSLEERAVHERTLLDLDVPQHLITFERDRVRAKEVRSTEETRRAPAGTKLAVVGNPIRLRFPPTQSGMRVIFFEMEDEQGPRNVTRFDDVYQRDGHVILGSEYVTVARVVQDRDGHAAFLDRPSLMRGGCGC